MAISFPEMQHFIGAYLHEDNQLSIDQVVKEYILLSPFRHKMLVQEINRLLVAQVSQEEKEKIAIEAMLDVSLKAYPISNSVTAIEWFANLKQLIEKTVSESDTIYYISVTDTRGVYSIVRDRKTGILFIQDTVSKATWRSPEDFFERRNQLSEIIDSEYAD